MTTSRVVEDLRRALAPVPSHANGFVPPLSPPVPHDKSRRRRWLRSAEIARQVGNTGC